MNRFPIQSLEALEPRRLLSAAVTAWGPVDLRAVPAAGDLQLEAEASTRWVIQQADTAALHQLSQTRPDTTALQVRPGVVLIESAEAVTAGDYDWLGGNASPIQPIDIDGRFMPVDALFGSQWYLDNTGQSGGIVGLDANLADAWSSMTVGPLDGTGTTIGIVDSGVFGSHPDLVGNYEPALSYDYLDDDPDPTPELAFDSHGTSVAGVATATGDATGIIGTAFGSTLAGLRIYSDARSTLTDDIGISGAIGHLNQSIDVYNHSWGPPDDGRRFEGPGVLSRLALEASATLGRGGLGNVHVWAGGNGGSNDDVNRDGYANSRHTIAVGAVTNQGVRASYSETSSALMLTAPSSGGTQSVTTVQGPSSYTNFFGGTSSAAPVVSGIVALMLQTNPLLSARDVQHILIESAADVDPGSPSWMTNAAGYDVSSDYGFGLVDAAAAVALADGWLPVSPEASYETTTFDGIRLIGDASTASLTAYSVPSGLSLEHVEVELTLDHAERGDLEIHLTSPGGTTSRLLRSNNDTNDDINAWTFTSVQQWGESSGGDWTITIADNDGNGIGGILTQAQLRFFGTGSVTPRPPIEPQVAQVTADPAATISIEVSQALSAEQVNEMAMFAVNDATQQAFSFRPIFVNGTSAVFQPATGDGLTEAADGSWLLPDGRYTLMVDGEVALEFHMLAGDASGDARVDLADFSILRNHFGRDVSAASSPFSLGDFDLSGRVDLADFTILRNQFGIFLAITDSVFADDDDSATAA
jgi:subtilisin-like proprotein convertase family protein